METPSQKQTDGWVPCSSVKLRYKNNHFIGWVSVNGKAQVASWGLSSAGYEAGPIRGRCLAGVASQQKGQVQAMSKCADSGGHLPPLACSLNLMDPKPEGNSYTAAGGGGERILLDGSWGLNAKTRKKFTSLSVVERLTSVVYKHPSLLPLRPKAHFGIIFPSTSLLHGSTSWARVWLSISQISYIDS